MKKKKTKEDSSIIIIICMWLAINIIPFIVGLIESGNHYTYSENGCDKKLSKIEYIIPGYQFGCYMGKPF